jgi:uracil-DNA glycosylase
VAAKNEHPIVFILWGGFAIKKKSIINLVNATSTTVVHKILEWGHPSPVSAFNQDVDNKKNFRYCDNFKRCNELLQLHKLPTINWSI